MTCKNASCKYEFCWVCMGPWKDHAGSYYNCNKFDPDKEKDTPDGKKKDTSRAALERYLHYYTRFTNHNNSLKMEIEAKTKMESKIREMEALGDNTWMDCLYLNEANEALYECRYTLQYTYVYAFYLDLGSNYRHQFEMQQVCSSPAAPLQLPRLSPASPLHLPRTPPRRHNSRSRPKSSPSCSRSPSTKSHAPRWSIASRWRGSGCATSPSFRRRAAASGPTTAAATSPSWQLRPRGPHRPAQACSSPASPCISPAASLHLLASPL